MSADVWADQLSQHPDWAYCNYLVRGVREGFRICFQYQSLGAVSPEVDGLVQVNRFGLVPKAHRPDKWRHIVYLSFPRGSCVNDGIEPEVCSLHYMSVDEACRRVVVYGKFNVIGGAFRTIPVYPEDRWLLGTRCQPSLSYSSA